MFDSTTENGITTGVSYQLPDDIKRISSSALSTKTVEVWSDEKTNSLLNSTSKTTKIYKCKGAKVHEFKISAGSAERSTMTGHLGLASTLILSDSESLGVPTRLTVSETSKAGDHPGKISVHWLSPTSAKTEMLRHREPQEAGRIGLQDLEEWAREFLNSRPAETDASEDEDAVVSSQMTDVALQCKSASTYVPPQISDDLEHEITGCLARSRSIVWEVDASEGEVTPPRKQLRVSEFGEYVADEEIRVSSDHLLIRTAGHLGLMALLVLDRCQKMGMPAVIMSNIDDLPENEFGRLTLGWELSGDSDVSGVILGVSELKEIDLEVVKRWARDVLADALPILTKPPTFDNPLTTPSRSDRCGDEMVAFDVHPEGRIFIGDIQGIKGIRLQMDRGDPSLAEVERILNDVASEPGFDGEAERLARQILSNGREMGVNLPSSKESPGPNRE